MKSRKEMIEEILMHEARTNDFIFTKERLENMELEFLSIVYEASKHMVRKY